MRRWMDWGGGFTMRLLLYRYRLRGLGVAVDTWLVETCDGCTALPAHVCMYVCRYVGMQVTGQVIMSCVTAGCVWMSDVNSPGHWDELRA